MYKFFVNNMGCFQGILEFNTLEEAKLFMKYAEKTNTKYYELGCEWWIRDISESKEFLMKILKADGYDSDGNTVIEDGDDTETDE